MPKAVISKNLLDALIKAKIANTSGCAGVVALPVVHVRRSAGCNWTVSGWAGDAPAVSICQEKVASYLAFLRHQFDIPEEPEGNRQRAMR